MPGTFTHLGVLDAVVRPLLPPSVRTLVEDHSEYAAWGAVGPDYLYFYAKDWGVIGHMSDVAFEMYDALEEVLRFFQQIGDTIGRVQDWLTGGLFASLRDAAEALMILIKQLFAKFVTSQVDFFSLYQPPIHGNATTAGVDSWWWADLAHHRETLSYARWLWNNAQLPEHKAYSVGYLSHIGTDLIGHPYVNLLTGGPYRMHWRRHGFIERILDTYLWTHWYQANLASSHAYKRVNFGSSGDLPDALANYLARGLATTFAPYQMKSGIPDATAIQRMYRLTRRWLRSSTATGGMNLPSPPDFDWYDLPDYVRDHLRAVIAARPSVSSPPLSSPTNLRQWKRFFRSLFLFCLWTLEAAVTIVSLPWAIVNRLATAPARYLLWLSQKLVYELSSKLRLAMVVGGFVHPEDWQVGAFFLPVVEPSNFHTRPYPYERVTNGDQTYHLAHPAAQSGRAELPPTWATTSLNSVPPQQLSRFLFNEVHTPAGIGGLADACALARAGHLGSLGDAQVATVPGACLQIIKEFVRTDGAHLPNWNLDGDRGYGWPVWRVDSDEPWDSTTDFGWDC
jgi:hypothetical protein